MTTTDITPGWCTGFETDPDDLQHPKYWYLYLHTGNGHHRIGELTFPTEETARRWAITNLRGLTEYE